MPRRRSSVSSGIAAPARGSMGLYGAPGGWSPRSLLAPGGGKTIPELVNEARALLDELEGEVRRLGFEVQALRTGNLIAFGPFGRIFDPLGIDERAASFEGLIERLENFVRDVFNRVEAKALAGDLRAAELLRSATARILNASRGSSPVQELKQDAKDTVDDAMSDLEKLLGNIAKAVGIGLGALIAFELLKAFNRARG